MSTNDEVKVDMPPENDENELDTSPQEHDDEIARDTATASEYESSSQEKVMSLLDQTVRNTTTASDNEISEEIVHTKILLPHEDQAGTSKPAGSSEKEILGDGTSLPQEDQIDDLKITEDLKKLYIYARDGKWDQAYREIFKRHPKNSKYLTAGISDNRDIALHVAVAENHPKFVNNLVECMTKEDLDIKNNEGNTAFFLAAESGILVNSAMNMYEKNKDLPSIPGKGERYPIYVAAYHGHKEMTEFLYKVKVEGSLEEKAINKLLKNKTLSEFFEDFKSLRRLVLKDDWDKAYEDFLKENKMYSIATISDRGNTALHIAVVANSSKFVRRLGKYMQKEDLAIKNRDGNTAFYLAALSGRVELAKLMFKKNDELPKIRGSNKKKMLPIHAAAEQDHKQMVEFLYTVSEKHLEEGDVYPLLRSLICMTDLSGKHALHS
ncbi:hypothetical protein Pint_11423 [Pistacia integerrima]|uniref:Uncharacterized protein n=1 Tax=Pistacia integerrima TaxID=434235 RepID=A0ACC0XKI1_9ROSI|nr:hypothetical protein Pint_11423 [Pistacia integerrima]